MFNVSGTLSLFEVIPEGVELCDKEVWLVFGSIFSWLFGINLGEGDPLLIVEVSGLFKLVFSAKPKSIFDSSDTKNVFFKSELLTFCLNKAESTGSLDWFFLLSFIFA